jgi:hypothetical protein
MESLLFSHGGAKMKISKNHERRLACYPISEEILSKIMQEGNLFLNGYKCISGVPKDALLVSSYFDWERNEARLIFYHPSFDIVREGEIIPLRNVVWDRIDESQSLYGKIKKFFSNIWTMILKWT